MLKRFSERYQPTGALAAEGVLNQLGRPSIEPLEVLVREAVQNCWDARRPDVETMEVVVGYHRLDEDQVSYLKHEVVSDPPPCLPLADVLASSVDLLYFADYGTMGLAGPTRADVEPEGPTDFVDFVRNIGQPPDKALGGGSFGYGKAAFYLASRASTVIIDTSCVPEVERRFIAYALGGHYRDHGAPFTGRHWWGVMRDGVPEPATGDNALALAAQLGFPVRNGEHGLGTTVAIVGPRLSTSSDDGDELPANEVLRFIGECLVWNFWPKMIGTRGVPPAMLFRLLDGDAEILVPDPRTHPRIAPFAEALDVLRDEDSEPDDPFAIRHDLHCLRPHRKVGTLAVHHTPTTTINENEGLLSRGARQMVAGVHHVALMRNAELVVKYEPGPAPLVPGRGYAGVFRCDLALDEIFRQSEPPTHDAWEPASLPDSTDRRLVNAALRRIREELEVLAGPRVAQEDLAETVVVSLGRFADELAALMPAFSGPGSRSAPLAVPLPGQLDPAVAAVSGPDGDHAHGAADAGGAGGGQAELGAPAAGFGPAVGPGTGGPQGPPGRGPVIAVVGDPELVLDDQRAAVIRLRVRVDTGGVDARGVARAEILTMDGGQVEHEPPVGAVVPTVLRWTAPDGSARDGDEIPIGRAESGEWNVWISHDPDVMVRVAVDVLATIS